MTAGECTQANLQIWGKELKPNIRSIPEVFAIIQVLDRTYKPSFTVLFCQLSLQLGGTITQASLSQQANDPNITCIAVGEYGRELQLVAHIQLVDNWTTPTYYLLNIIKTKREP